MPREKIQQYKGRLSAAEVSLGINCARKNAQRVVGDADVLLGLGRYPSALALAVLAIEEAGKIPILRSLALARSDEEAKTDWRDYRKHTSKHRVWHSLEYAMKGARNLNDFARLFASDVERPAILDQLKQLAFYTDLLDKRLSWSMPTDVIGKDLATITVQSAKILAKGEEVTQREIELWMQHLGSVWKQSNEAMEKGLADWYAALQAEGLKATGENEMRQFILNGFT